MRNKSGPIRHTPINRPAHSGQREDVTPVSTREPLSLLTFLLYVAAAVGIGVALLHRLSLWFQ